LGEVFSDCQRSNKTMETYVAFSTYSRANDKLKKTNMEKIKGC
jgi:hypothetical protein